MDIALLNSLSKDTMAESLGIEYTLISEGRVEATMPVDNRTRQPFGKLSGGATIALAETLAGAGSVLLCQEDEVALGIQVSANHMVPAMDGDTVRAIATTVHVGRTSHVWNVDVYRGDGRLISSIRVTNAVRKKK